jgi:hypothetical protein
MTEARTYAWIFCAASAIPIDQPGKYRDIEAVADGINHAVPTQKEMDASISWSESKGLLQRSGKKIQLTEEGRDFEVRLDRC